MGLFVWRHRSAAGAWPLIGVLAAMAVWALCYSLELASYTVAAAQVWSGLKYVGVVVLPPSLLLFVQQYTGRPAPHRVTLILLAVEPLVVLALLAVPDTARLIHYYAPEQVRAVRLLEPPIPLSGPLFWVHAAYNWGLTLAALAVLVVRLSRISGPYRRQARVAMVIAPATMAGNVLWNLGVFGASSYDPEPILFTVLAVVLVWGFFRLRMIDLAPVAADVVLKQLDDGVLVLDVHDRVVSANPAAVALLGLSEEAMIGRSFSSLLPDVASRTVAAERTQRFGTRLLDPAGGPGVRDVAVTMTQIDDSRARRSGRAVLLQDVTAREAQRRRLEEVLAEQTRVTRGLQSGLWPTTLPDVPGVRTAVRSLPATEPINLPPVQGGPSWTPRPAVTSLVSGDFYDLHRVRGGDWAFVLGDISGKGMEAALRTSMARYTARTLSAEGRDPCDVLAELNQALLAEDTDRFATVLYGRLSDLGEPGHRRLTLVLGGHPQPLLRRHDSADVVPVGVPGTALGLLPCPELTAVDVDLHSGDVLLCFTDGVTEARRGRQQFGDERLADLLGSVAPGLRGRTGPAAAALVADAVADQVLAQVTEWSVRRDDVALLVLVVA